MLTRYEFISNPHTIADLNTFGFENTPGIPDYYFVQAESIKGGINVHILYINKTTNLLTYRLNNDDFDYLDIEKINPLIARKLLALIHAKMIKSTDRLTTDTRYKRGLVKKPKGE